jgi:hypothetical protein
MNSVFCDNNTNTSCDLPSAVECSQNPEVIQGIHSLGEVEVYIPQSEVHHLCY